MPFDFLEMGLPAIERQRFSNWCWAASTLFVCDFYQTHPSLTQPRLVANVLGIPSCASGLPSGGCNRQHDLGDAFHFVGHLEDEVDSPLTPSDISRLFQHGEGPIGCQMLMPLLGGGHAVVMTGAKINAAGKLFVTIADPGDASILTIPFEVFRNNYRGQGGHWIRSYITK